MKIIRTDKANGKEELTDWTTAMLALSDCYRDLSIAQQALLDGETLQTNFATYRIAKQPDRAERN
ncbi:hypothetical protein KAR91_27360 [Candidatus Pacearchaeota archaeon]|nr:hypothetical protein [Candidatus Pacearchaeota archaeon]